MRIRTVLCPVDFSSRDEAEVAIAAEVCRTFGAKLVLHHNLAAAEPGFSRAWEWAKAHEAHEADRPDAEARLRALRGRIGAGIPSEAIVTAGPVGQVVLALAERLAPDLLVLGSHGWSTQDHVSVTERLIRQSPCPVLTFQEGTAAGSFRLAGDPPPNVLVPTDFMPDSEPAVAYALDLARQIPVRLTLLHVLPDTAGYTEEQRVATALDSLVPIDLADRIAGRVERGDPVERIIHVVHQAEISFAVLGEHAHGLLRHLFTTDTTRAVVHGARRPVWVVPPGYGS